MSFRTFVSSFMEKAQVPGSSSEFNAGINRNKRRALFPAGFEERPTLFSIARDHGRQRFLEKSVSTLLIFKLY